MHNVSFPTLNYFLQCATLMALHYFTLLYYISGDICRTQEGPANRRLLNFCPYVRPSVTNLFSCVLLCQYTSDPQYFYRFRTPYKLLVGGLIRGAPDPPNPPPMGGLKYILEGYYWLTILTTIEWNKIVKLLTSSITWAILGESTNPPYPLPP